MLDAIDADMEMMDNVEKEISEVLQRSSKASLSGDLFVEKDPRNNQSASHSQLRASKASAENNRTNKSSSLEYSLNHMQSQNRQEPSRRRSSTR